jgi:hypothetical protein
VVGGGYGEDSESGRGRDAWAMGRSIPQIGTRPILEPGKGRAPYWSPGRVAPHTGAREGTRPILEPGKGRATAHLPWRGSNPKEEKGLYESAKHAPKE